MTPPLFQNGCLSWRLVPRVTVGAGHGVSVADMNSEGGWGRSLVGEPDWSLARSSRCPLSECLSGLVNFSSM